MDPPSLPAATVDVVPSSAMRRHESENAPPRRGLALAIIALGLLIALAIALVAAFGPRR